MEVTGTCVCAGPFHFKQSTLCDDAMSENDSPDGFDEGRHYDLTHHSFVLFVGDFQFSLSFLYHSQPMTIMMAGWTQTFVSLLCFFASAAAQDVSAGKLRSQGEEAMMSGHSELALHMSGSRRRRGLGLE